MTLTIKEIDYMLWLANRRSRKVKADPGNAACLEDNLVERMRPHFHALLKAARRDLERRGSK